jgi:hypothetical protein
MSETFPFFSQQWCDAAREAANANEAMYQGFKDPATFTHIMALSVIGRDDLTSYVEFKEAQIISWVSGATLPDSEIWAVIAADPQSWRDCAEGRSEGQKALIAGKLKLLKGPITAAIENADALNNYLYSWGQVPTDWNI